MSACTSGPTTRRVVDVAEGDSVVVVLRQPQAVLHLRSPDAQATTRATAHKIATIEGLQALLDVWGGAGFFDHARGIPADDTAANEIGAVIGGRSWFLRRSPGAPVAAQQAYNQSFQAFFELYNSIQTLQLDDDTTPEELESQWKQIEQNNRRKRGKTP